MDIVYTTLAALLGLAVYGLARACARLQGKGELLYGLVVQRFVGERGGRHGSNSRSFNDFGDQEQAAFDNGCTCLVRLTLVGFADHVIAQAQRNVLDGSHWVGERFDTSGVDGTHLFNNVKKTIDLG